MAPRLAPVGDEGGKGAASDAVGDVVDGCADDVVAAADGEGHSMAGVRRIGLENAVGGGVVARGVHGVAASFVEGGGEAHVARGPACDCGFGGHGSVLFNPFFGVIEAGSSCERMSEGMG